MKPIGYASIALVVIAVVATLVRSQTARQLPNQVRPPSAAIQRPAVRVQEGVTSGAEPEEVRKLRNQVNQLNVDVQRLRNTVADATGAAADGEPTVALSPEEQEQRWLDHVQLLDRAFRDEPLEEGWSRQMTDQIRAELSQDELAAGSVVDVDCRSTTCKLQLADLVTPRGEAAIQRLIIKFSGALQNAAIAHDGDLTSPKPTALYLSKARPEDSVPLVARR